MTKKHTALIVALCVALFVSPAAAPAGLVQTYQQTGQLGVEFVAAAGGNFNFIQNGMFNLSQVSGPVAKAYFYAADYANGSAPLDLILNNIAIPAAVISTDTVSGATMFGYRWDVTNFVIGNGNYTYDVGMNVSGNQITSVGLVVVYQTGAGPNKTVKILDGIEQIGVNNNGLDSKSYVFSNLPAGPTDLWTLTGYDGINTSNPPPVETGEVIDYNGTPIGGPIDGFLGFNASLLQMTGMSITGNNTLTVTTGPNTGPMTVDHFGVMANVALVTVPEPASMVLLLLGLIGCGVIARRRIRR